MFLSRFLTACVLIPLVLLGLFKAPTFWLLWVAGILLLGCGWEFLALIPCKQRSLQLSFLLGLLLISWLTVVPLGFVCLWSLSLIFWIYLTYAVLRFPQAQSEWGHPQVLALWGLSLLPISVVCLARIYTLAQGQAWLLYLLLIIWATDTGAYIAGKRFGTHPLIPNVSPGKTREGMLGGFLLAGLVGLVGYFYFSPRSVTPFMLQWFITVIAGILGDLSMSMFKRRVKCKDTGRLLPGHGGLLDRLDSLIAAAPFFYAMAFMHC